MLYNNFYDAGPDRVKKQTQEGVSTVGKPVYSGLFVHNIDQSGVAAVVENAIAGGASGVSIFSADGMDAAKWKIIQKTD